MKDCSSVVQPGYKAKRFLWRQTVWHLRTISVVYIQISITYDFIIVPAAFDLSLYKLSDLFWMGSSDLRTILCWTAEHMMMSFLMMSSFSLLNSDSTLTTHSSWAVSVGPWRWSQSPHLPSWQLGPATCCLTLVVMWSAAARPCADPYEEAKEHV